MARNLRFSIGPRRVSPGMSPSQSGYIRHMRAQFKELEDDFGDFIKHIQGITPDAVAAALKPIFDLSQKYVPVDTSKLKNSGFILVKETSKGASGVVGYAAGGVPDYALIVHENLDFSHKAPTQARFLARAIEELFFTVQKALVADYEKAAKKKTGTAVKFTVTQPSESDRAAALVLPGSNK